MTRDVRQKLINVVSIPGHMPSPAGLPRHPRPTIWFASTADSWQFGRLNRLQHEVSNAVISSMPIHILDDLVT